VQHVRRNYATTIEALGPSPCPAPAMRSYGGGELRRESAFQVPVYMWPELKRVEKVDQALHCWKTGAKHAAPYPPPRESPSA
jgi:hypothetical protein